MDKQMYDAIKAAMREGKSIEDIVTEAEDLAQTAKKELQPKPATPLKDKYGATASAYTLRSHAQTHKLNKDSLITAVATYFVQNGFDPDPYFDSEADFRAHIEGIIDRGLTASIGAAKIATMRERNASDEEIAMGMVDYLASVIRDLFD